MVALLSSKRREAIVFVPERNDEVGGDGFRSLGHERKSDGDAETAGSRPGAELISSAVAASASTLLAACWPFGLVSTNPQV